MTTTQCRQTNSDSINYKSLIPSHRLPALPAKIPPDLAGILPVTLHLAQHGGVAGPGIAAQGLQVRDQPGPEGIQVDITGGFQQIEIFLTDDRLVAVLNILPASIPRIMTRCRVPGASCSGCLGIFPSIALLKTLVKFIQKLRLVPLGCR